MPSLSLNLSPGCPNCESHNWSVLHPNPMPLSMTLDSLVGSIRAEFSCDTICYDCGFVAFVDVLGGGTYKYRLFKTGEMMPGRLSRPRNRAEEERYPKCWVNTSDTAVKVKAIRGGKIVGRKTCAPGEQVFYADDCDEITFI